MPWIWRWTTDKYLADLTDRICPEIWLTFYPETGEIFSFSSRGRIHIPGHTSNGLVIWHHIRMLAVLLTNIWFEMNLNGQGFHVFFFWIYILTWFNFCLSNEVHDSLKFPYQSSHLLRNMVIAQLLRWICWVLSTMQIAPNGSWVDSVWPFWKRTLRTCVFSYFVLQFFHGTSQQRHS